MQRHDNPLHVATRIAVDDRERSSGVAEALGGRSDVDITFRRLSLGDYEVDGTLTRISHQLSAAASDAPHPAGFSRLGVLDVL